MPRRMPPARSAFDTNGFTPVTNGFTPDVTVEQHPESCFTVFQKSHPARPAGHPAVG
ncbi:hypothetical protein M5E06_28680 [Azospirillum sp. A1-3]|uniref:hypothetical protein n=1 Tax=Azospirillum sp. A1-3 TaxID=185874 RepID=UPI00207707C1|nr:hypothetical protein [Azospirillum sp. A1-3]MCM8738103.1 hypothetical protein [Azospirillum sp. A1-3]